MPKFFLMVTPGFESAAADELGLTNAKVNSVEVVKGGVEFEADLSTGFALNKYLRIPTKILLRLEERNCKSFDELRDFLHSLPLKDYLVSPKLKIKVSAFRSKLYHKRQLEDVCSRSIKKYIKENNLKFKSDQTNEIFIRIEHNYAQISINTSGEALFKRGYKLLSGVAPLRETLAYACLFSVVKDFTADTKVKLLDPMCGSGTFLLEAAQFNQPNDRDFICQTFPVYKKTNKVNIEKKQATEFLLEGWDLDPKNIKNIKSTAVELGAKNLEVKVANFFNEDLGAADLIVFNPPYGERLSLPMPPKKFWPEIHNKLKSSGTSTAAFIAPDSGLKFLPKPNRQIRFSNGGVDVCLCIYKFS